MDWQGDSNAHNAKTTLKNVLTRSTHADSLDNVNLGGNVSIGLNTSPSAPFIYKNYSPIVSNAFPFYNKK